MTEKTLYDLEVGDKVCVIMHGTPRFIRKIKRTTKIQIILEDDSRWRKDDGKEFGFRGNEKWYHKDSKRIEIPTDATILIIMKKSVLASVIKSMHVIEDHLKNSQVKNLSARDLKCVLEKVEEAKKVFSKKE